MHHDFEVWANVFTETFIGVAPRNTFTCKLDLFHQNEFANDSKMGYIYVLFKM